MPTGLLEVTGAITLDQFWPVGTSDADTTKIQVTVSEGAFRFRPSPRAPFRTTHVFDDAIVDGETDKPAIDAKGRVTVRLQGIDAPELHYRPAAAIKRPQRTPRQQELYLEWNLEFRQFLAETATDNLCRFLKQFNRDPLPCRILTAVDTPDDVFDTYARLVGDIVVGDDSSGTNINRWLIEQGHALPAFYESMSREEIAVLTDLYKNAKAHKRGLWDNHYRSKIGQFRWNLVFRGRGATLDSAADLGSVILPKLFRRQATFRVNKRAGMVSGSLETYLRGRNDEMHLVDEFLEHGPEARIYRWQDLLANNEMRVSPDQIVFCERSSRIRKPSGGPVEW